MNGHGLDIHLRTTMVENIFSYIESSVVRLGDSIIEFQQDKIILDRSSEYTYDMLPFKVESADGHTYDIVDASTNEKHRLTRIILNDLSRVAIRLTKSGSGGFMTVDLEGDESDFGNSVGLLGNYHTGELLGRDGQLIEDTVEFGMEWQVRPEESLFMESRSPQLPYERCRMPTQSLAKESRRRLRTAENKELLAQATQACAGSVDFELCIQDVMTTGEVAMADMF